MKKFYTALSFILLIFCAVVFASCGESGNKPSISVSESNIELVFGSKESAAFDITLSNYGNGSDAVRVETYDENIISFTTKKHDGGKSTVTVNAVYPGSATLKISSVYGSATPVEVSVNVVLPLDSISIKDTSLSMVKGDSVDLTKLDLIEYNAIKTQSASLESAKTNQIGVSYDIDNTSKIAGARIENGVISLEDNFVGNQIVVTATSVFNKSIKQEFTIKVLNQISTKLYVDDVQIFENKELCEDVSSAFEIYPRENDESLRTKQIKLVANSGDGTELIAVTPVYNSEKLSVILKSFEYQNSAFVYYYEVTALNTGLLDDLKFDVSYRQDVVSVAGSSYFSETGTLTMVSYSIPTTVLVNGTSGVDQQIEIVVYEDVIQIAKGTGLLFNLSPDDLAPKYTQIRIWAEDFNSLPINLYRLNQDRSAYELLFGYNGNNAVYTGRDGSGNYYLDIDVKTKLFAITNGKVNANNMTAKLFAISKDFYGSESSRSKLTINVDVNPSSQAIYLADKNNDVFSQNTKTLIVSEIDNITDVFFAISPYNFNIGTTSSVRLKNSSLADVSKLEAVVFDEDYLYVKATISPKKLGATKLVVTLCDGLVKEFDLKIISKTQSLNVYLEQDFENQIDYKQAVYNSDQTSSIEKIAMKNSLSLQLNKVVSPITAEYTLNYEFFEGYSNDKALSSYTYDDIFEDVVFSSNSNLIDVSLLKNYSILQAKSNSAEGKVLVKITANTRDDDGNLTQNSKFVFYYFIEFYSGVEYFSVSKSSHEVYTYESIGDKNIDKSIAEFTISMRSVAGNPTYANNLQLIYGEDVVISSEHLSFREANGKFIISASVSNNVWSFRVQALKGEGAYVFKLKLVELDESRAIGGIVRIFAENAVEISEIELIDINLNDGIYIDNSETAVNNQIEYQIQYNTYTEGNKEPLNSSLEFEIVGNFGKNNKGESLVSVSNTGKVVVLAGAGGSGYIKIYPTSNFFYSFGGLKDGEKPFVVVPLVVANGTSEESAIRILTESDLSKLSDNKFYKLGADIKPSDSSDFSTISSFSGNLNGNGHTLTVNKPLFTQIASGGKVHNLTILGSASGCALAITNNGTIKNVNTSGLTISGTDSAALVLTNEGTIDGGEIVASISGTNVGGVAQINNGTIKNVVFAGNIVVSGASGYVGGIASENNGTIESCKVIKYAESSSEEAKQIILDEYGASHIGAIAGYSAGTISKCFGARYGKDCFDISSTGTNTIVGGIVGFLENSDLENSDKAVVSECNTNLNMSAGFVDGLVGGLVGGFVGGLVGEYKSGTVTNCYVRSKVNSDSAKNFAYSGTLGNNFTNCYSTAYYLDGATKTYIDVQGQTGTALYCAVSENFENAVNGVMTTDVWGRNELVNDGLPYLKNALPHETVESFDLTVENSSQFLVDDTQKTIIFFFNKLISGANSEIAKKQLENLNTISLSSLFGKEFSDYKIKLLNTSALQTYADKIRIVNVGTTSLDIQSKYASESCIDKSYTIFVIYPVSSFNVFNGRSTSLSQIIENGDSLNVKYNNSGYFTTNSNSSVVLDNQTYQLFTNLVSVGIKAYYRNTESDPVVDVIANNIIEGMQTSFDGSVYDEYKFVGEGVFKISPSKTTFASSVNIEAFLAIQNDGVGSYYGNLTASNIEKINAILKANFTRNFTLNVYQGADRIQASISESTITASDVLNFDVSLNTDNASDKIIVKIYDENNNLVEYYDGKQKSFDAEGKVISDDKPLFDIKVAETNESKKYNVYVNINENHKGNFSNNAKYTIVVCDITGGVETPNNVLTTDKSGRVSSKITLNIAVQQVTRISAYHYASNSDGETFSVQSQPTVVLKPATNGLIAINLYPSYAKFEKIVIESAIVDGCYVLFEQMVKGSGESYVSASGQIGYSFERVENKLIIYPNTNTLDNGMIYVRTKIMSGAVDGTNFPITISVYPSTNGEIKSAGLTLTSQTINKAEITIDGKKDAVATRGNSIAIQVVTREDEYIGNVSVVDYYTSNNKNDYININLNSAEYEVINGFNVYNGYLNIGLDAEINGDGVVKIQTTMFRNINGITESAIEFATLRIVDFTVESVYIEGNNEDDNVFVVPLQIEKNLSFAFKLSPLPVVSNMEEENSSIARIKANREYFLNNTAIEILNGNYNYSINDEFDFTEENYIISGNANSSNKLSENEKTANFIYNIYLNGSKIWERNGITRTNNYVKFNIAKDGNGKPTDANLIEVTGLRTGNSNFNLKFNIVYPGGISETFSYNFVVSVKEYEDEDNPLPIATEEEFIKYMNATSTESGEPANYILLNDLYLTDFVPFRNTNLIETLDGNNKIITIKNFDLNSILTSASGQTLNLALFTDIGINTTIKNLTINYYELEDIIINESLVKTVNVAGLFINNSGIVYNCEVTSINLASEKSKVSTEMGLQFDDFGVGLDKDYVSKKYVDGNGIRIYFDENDKSKFKQDSTTVNVAGFGVNNSSSGRITNSRFGSSTFTKVYRYVEDTISVKEITLDASMFNITAQAEIAGFVLSNNGLISSSCADNFSVNNTAISGSNLRTSGFVIENNYGAYITSSFARGHKNISDINSPFYRGGGISSQGISAGFVYQNNSQIIDCFANVNLTGNSSSRIVSGFVFENESSGTIERCYSASTISGQLTTRMPFSGVNAKGDSTQNGKFTYCYYLVTNFDTDTILEEKYNTGAYGIYAGTLKADSFYGFSFCDDRKSAVWFFNENEAKIASTENVAISSRYILRNYNGNSGVNKFPYVSGYELGSDKNPIVIRSADEFNRAFGDTSTLKQNTYYALTEKYDKNKGIVFGSYRLISNIDFSTLSSVSSTKVASSIMTLKKTTAGSGMLDGNGLKILNIEIALADSKCVGFIGQLQNGAVVKNLNLTVVQVTGANGVYVGGVCGLCVDSSIVNINVESVNISGDNRSEINGRNIVGGVVGLAKGKSKLANLSSNISVISNYLSGETKYNRIASSINEDKKLGYAGGIAGIIDIYASTSQSSVFDEVNVNKLYVHGSSLIVKGYSVGGIAGYIGVSTNAKDMSFIVEGLTDSSKQQLISTGDVIGGLVAYNYGNISESYIEHEASVQKSIENSVSNYYSSSSTSKQGNSSLFVFENNSIDSYAGGLVGIMENGELAYCYSKVDVVGTTNTYAGGLVGWNMSSKRYDEVYAFGDVSGKYAGGLIGKNGKLVNETKVGGNLTLNRAVAINFYSKANANILKESNMIEVINQVNKLTNGVAGINSENNAYKHSVYGNGTISYSNSVLTFTYQGTYVSCKVKVNSSNKIVSIVPNTLGSLVGENNGTLNIGSPSGTQYNNQAVFANTELTINSVAYSFDTCASGTGTIENGAKANNLVVGYNKPIKDSDYPTLNSMFLGANWNEQIWQKTESDMLPKLIHGVVSKLLYIEIPEDFLKLWRYKENDMVVIIGDNPATSFNPYNYVKDNSITYGEYTQSQLAGLTVSGSDLYYDLSSIKDSFKNTDFSGVLRGELEGHKYYISGLNSSLFDSISGATITNVGFGVNDSNNKNVSNSSLLANSVVNSNLENIYVKNLSANLSNLQTEAGLLVNSLTNQNAITLKNFAFENVDVTLNGNSGNDLTFGFICPILNNVSLIEDVLFSGCQVSVSNSEKFQLGFIAGTNSGTSGQITFKNVKISGESNKIEATATNAYIGGFVGQLNMQSTFTYGIQDNNAKEIIKNLTIDFAGVTGTANIGLVFGKSNEILSENFISIDGKITNNNNIVANNYPVANIGGFAGEGCGTISNLNITCPITAKVKETVSGTTTISSAIGGVVGKASGILTLENVSQDGNIAVTSTTGITSVGGIVGKAISHNLTLIDITVGTITGEKPNQTTTEISANSTATGINDKTNVGGIIGFAQNQTTSLTITSGKTITINSNLKAEGKDSENTPIGTFNVGGVVGDIKTSSLTMKAKCEVKSNFDVEGSVVNIGGFIGNSSGTNVTIADGKDSNNADIHYTTTASGDMTIYATGKSNVGGIIGSFAGAKLEISSSKNVYSGNISYTNKSSRTAYIGGVAGYINANAGSESSVSYSHYNNGIISLDGTNNASMIAGGIVGYIENCNITTCYVSGHIEVPSQTISKNLFIGGVVGWAETSTISSTLSWGNIRLVDVSVSNNNPIINIGGMIGYVGTNFSVTLTSNSTLTSIYNTKWLGDKAYIHAVVGDGTISDASSGNKYSSQYNLATDSTTNVSDDATLNLFKNGDKDKLGNTASEESKLNPKAISNQSTFDSNVNSVAINGYKYYSLSNLTISGLNIPANAHILGNGNTLKNYSEDNNVVTLSANGTKSIVGTNDGVIANAKFDFETTFTNGLLSGAPSGIAQENNGIIYGCVAKISGSALSTYEKSKWTESFNSGAVQTNTGLISDTGVVVYGKNAYAGFVKDNQGVISNCYANGVVQNGAMFSFNGGAGTVYNSYTSVRSSGILNTSQGSNHIFNGTLISCYYDKNGTEQTQSTSAGVLEEKETAKSASNITVTVLKNNLKFNASTNWVVDSSKNFGYPYLENRGAFETTNEIPNLGVLEKLTKNGYAQNLTILTDLDYANAYVLLDSENKPTHTSFAYSTGTFEGNNFEISSIPSNFFTSLTNTTIQNANFTFVETPTLNATEVTVIIEDETTTETSVGALANTANNSTFNHIVVSGATITTSATNVGGVVGKVDYATLNFVFNHNTINISSGSAKYVGGIIGYYAVEYEKKYRNNGNYGNISVTSTESLNVGGIAGNSKCLSEYYDSYNVANISAKSVSGKTLKIGGIVGDVNAISICDNQNYGTVSTIDGNSAKTYIGGIAGDAINCSISRNFNYGSVSGSSTSEVYAGGICGYASYITDFSSCGNEGEISGTSTGSLVYVGGIAGYTTTTANIESCYNTGNVNGTGNDGSALGGIVGYTTANITNCSSSEILTCNVKNNIQITSGASSKNTNESGDGVGVRFEGYVKYVSELNITIALIYRKSYSISKHQIAFFEGNCSLDDAILNNGSGAGTWYTMATKRLYCTSEFDDSHSYSDDFKIGNTLVLFNGTTGSASGGTKASGNYVSLKSKKPYYGGGIAGYCSGNVTDCYCPEYDNNDTKQFIIGSGGGTVKTEGGTPAKKASLLEEANKLKWTSHVEEPTIDGTTINISNASELAWVVANYDIIWSWTEGIGIRITINLTADIDLHGYIWIPIGSGAYKFESNFYGNGHTISGMAVGNFMDCFDGCKISNVKLVNSNVYFFNPNNYTSIESGVTLNNLLITDTEMLSIAIVKTVFNIPIEIKNVGYETNLFVFVDDICVTNTYINSLSSYFTDTSAQYSVFGYDAFAYGNWIFTDYKLKHTIEMYSQSA